MHIVYAVTTCSESVYEQLFSHVKQKPAAPAQKYHRLLIEGLAEHVQVDVVANPPVNRSLLDREFTRLPRQRHGKACYHHLSAVRNPLLKLAYVSIGTFFKTLSLIRRDSVVVVDCLNQTVGLAALLAARLRGARCVCVVTDVPSLLYGDSKSTRLEDFIIRHSTDYIFLTEAMNGLLNPDGKPYVVLEGHADITMAQRENAPENKAKPRICLYAGAISRLYGLDMLVKAFQKLDRQDARLMLYGNCDFEQELLELIGSDSRICYGGMLLSSQIVGKEMEAALLVNPRPTHEEYVKYSFPSKTMEYMASGTPVLTTRLPGMPAEYYPHVYFIKEETVDGIAAALEQVLDHSDEELHRKGSEAKEFILKNRNNVVQAEKILDMLKATERK